MHFKVPIWEFKTILKKEFHDLASVQMGSLLCVDPLLMRICRDHLKSCFLEKDIFDELKVTWGQDLKKDWIEDNLLNMGLFSAREGYFINNAEEIPSKVKSYLWDHFKGENRLISPCVFFLFSKEDSFQKKLLELDKSSFSLCHWEVGEGRFWEVSKVLEFLCDDLSVSLTQGARAELLQLIENSPLSLYQTLSSLKLLYDENPSVKIRPITLPQVLEVIQPSVVNHFKLSSIYTEKKFETFFFEVLQRGGDFDSLRSLFSFMQNHLLKLYDTEFFKQKQKLNRYEQEIMARSKNWSKEEILDSLRLFGKLEIFAKQRDPLLWDQLRSARISYL